MTQDPRQRPPAGPDLAEGPDLVDPAEPELSVPAGGLLRRRALILGAAVAVTGGAVAVLSTGFGRDPSVVPSTLIAKPAPALAGPTLDGGRFDLAALRGRVVLVNVWASWCPPCRAEYPVLVAASRALGPRGLSVVGINTQDNSDRARAFLQELGGEIYPSVLDANGRLAVQWGTFGVPETFVVDAAGNVRARGIGEVNAQWIDENVVPLLAS